MDGTSTLPNDREGIDGIVIDGEKDIAYIISNDVARPSLLVMDMLTGQRVFLAKCQDQE